MKIYTFIGMFGDLIDEVKTSDSYDKAKKDFKKYTGIDFRESEELKDELDEDYLGSTIYETELR